jgi:two-component sensor histidine kinase
VTELVSNVVRHAYPDGRPGLLEVDVECESQAADAAITVRDWGCGFGASILRPCGVGLGIVSNISGGLRIESPKGRTEVHARIPASAPTSGIASPPACQQVSSTARSSIDARN